METTVNEILATDEKKLAVEDMMRQQGIVNIVLKAWEAKMPDVSDDLANIINASDNQRVRDKLIMELMTKNIMQVVKGKMTVTEYVEKNKSKQSVWAYLGTHWQKIDVQLYYVFMKRCARKMGLEEIMVEDTDFMNKVFEKFAFRLMEYKKVIQAPDTVYVNVMNGTLEIGGDGSCSLREHHADDFFGYVLPYVYDPQADCPQWHAFLDKVLPEKEMQTVLAEYIAYCFTKNLKCEKMAVLYGTGSNGKSVCMDVISNLLGASNVSNLTLSSLTMDDEKRAIIEGKLANISHESNGQLDTAMLKQIISGEPTEVRVLYKGTHTMYDIPKLFTSYNRLPNAETTVGFFRRWLLFPFEVTITEEEQDIDLTAKLNRELPGILNWVLEALVGLVSRKAFGKSKKCDDALKAYKNTSNSVMMFVSERCDFSDTATTSLTELYLTYTKFCSEESLQKFGKKNFQEIIRNCGAKASTYQNRARYNIILTADDGDKE